MQQLEQTTAVDESRAAEGLVDRLRDACSLTKPGIVLSNVLAAGFGMWLVSTDASLLPVVGGLGGLALLVAACGAFNMAYERDTDRRMERTADRPVAAGRVSVWSATLFGVVLLVAASVVLLATTNLTAWLLGLAATFLYAAVYTPLKRVTTAAIPIGAVAGALPPVIGWTAMGGTISTAPLLLFAILFLWQFPHFLGIGLHRWRDYERAGLRFAPSPRTAHRTVWTSRLTFVGLVACCLALGVDQGLSALYISGALAGLLPLGVTVFAEVEEAEGWGRRVFLASLPFLPLFGLSLLLDGVIV